MPPARFLPDAMSHASVEQDAQDPGIPRFDGEAEKIMALRPARR
jgi:hypothetical protein